MIATPVTPNCRAVFDRCGHAVIGISPFNSYFTVSRIRDLVEWGERTFDRIHLFVPDVPAAYTLQSTGYSWREATRKARRQANYLHNKIQRALDELGVSTRACEMVLGWNKLNELEAYRQALDTCTKLFQTDRDFRAGCLASARWVLEKRAAGRGLSKRALALAARYFLTEIPLFADSVGILEQSSSAFCYHQCPVFVRELLDGRHALRVSQNQGFLVVQPANDARTEASRFTIM